MKRLASALLIAFGALCLHAGEQTTTTTTTSAQPPADSPLVRAAKAAQSKTPSKSKKKIVITNETLAKSGGHITTSNSQAALPPLPKPDPNVADIERQKQLAAQQAATDKAKQAAVDKKKRDEAEHANAILEGDDPEGIYEDPARSEGRAEKSSPPPPTMQVQKPPM